MEFFPIYVEQMEENEQFRKLSPLKKCYYFMLQSRFNKQREFYCRDTEFAAALNCSDKSIKAARPEFIKNGWIDVIPGHKDKRGRGLSTVYKSVKWSDPPKKGDNKQFYAMQRYAFEMILQKNYMHESVVVYLVLNYWRGFNRFDEGDFYITKSKLRELTNIDSMDKIEKCLEELSTFRYAGETPLFKYKDKYHNFHFDEWAMPADPMDDDNARTIQKTYWQSIAAKGKELEKEKQAKLQKEKLKELSHVVDLFKSKFTDYYNQKPANYDYQAADLLSETEKIGVERMEKAINGFFSEKSIPGVPPSSKRTLGKFLSIRYWETISQ